MSSLVFSACGFVLVGLKKIKTLVSLKPKSMSGTKLD